MPVKEPSVNRPAETAPDHDWEERKLCSDGNCIGVIGPDGNCKECGKPYRGDPFGADPLGPNDEGNDELNEADRPEEWAEESDNPVSTDTDTEWENRTLCSDGNCIGVIGPDGNCKECGLPHQPEE